MSLCIGIWKDLVYGAGWVLLECWRQMPELTGMDGAGQARLWGPLEDWLELCAEGCREVVRRHPLLSSV